MNKANLYFFKHLNFYSWRVRIGDFDLLSTEDDLNVEEREIVVRMKVTVVISNQYEQQKCNEKITAIMHTTDLNQVFK